jgi:cephalosporin-C deacetylase-like acetyl esterase
MKNYGCWFGLSWLLVQSLASAAPLEAYGKLPLFEHVVLSPDGKRAAYVTTIGEQRSILIQSLADNAGVIKLNAGPQMLRSLSWAGPDQLLVTTSQPRAYFAGPQSEGFALQNFDLRRQSAFNPMKWADYSYDLLAREPEVRIINQKPFVFQQSFTRARAFDRYEMAAFYRMDLKNQTTTLIDAQPESNPRQSYDWMVDASGRLIVQTIYDEETKRWSLYLKRNDRWIEVQSEQALIDAPYILGLAPEDNTIVLHRIEDGQSVPRRLSLIDGKWGEAFPNEWRGNKYIEDPQTHRLMGVVRLGARRSYFFYDKAMQEQWNQVMQSFPDEEVQLESWSDDRQKLVVEVFGKKTGAGYVVADLANKSMSYAGNLYADIDAKDIATVKAVSYSAADGLQITGYLTLPNGRELKNMPLVVLPHGGPASRDSFSFDWWAQALASKGYAVLQPNYRGSNGLGLAFLEKGYGEWGGKMQTDLSDGVRQLAKLGLIDPTRVCIVGASYGGYAALAAAAFEPSVYRCAVSVAGVSDMRKLLSDQINGRVSDENRSSRYLLRYVGTTKQDDPKLDAISPVHHADQVKIPVLLIHGDNDSVVQFEQSQIMANALKKAGKQFELVKLKSEDHWLSKAATRTQMLQATVKFLETNNPP